MDIVDDAWRKDKLPEEDIAVPLSELPDPESDNGESYVRFISYSMCYNWRQISKLASNFGCLFTFFSADHPHSKNITFE